MGDLIRDDQDALSRYVSDTPPTHYIVKIQLFSLLAKNSIDKYESGDFKAGGYKWKLVIHPTGNKSKNVKDNISFYLAMSGTNSLQPNWEVFAVYRLFLLDQNKDNYLVRQDGGGKERRFYGMKNEWGFDRFITFKDLNEASNGYIVDDTCVIGAEVFVSRERSRGKGESFSIIKEPITYKNVWKIDNFSKLDSDSYNSNIFIAGDHKWKIEMYPKGEGNGIGSHLSLYLALADPTTLSSATKVYADVTLRILDQTYTKHVYGKVRCWLSASNPEAGWSRFMLQTTLSQSNMGFLVKDNCVVEAELTILGLTNASP